MKELLTRFPALECVKNDIIGAFELIKTTFENRGRLLLCGNGGSAADCDHIAGELMKSFKMKRPIDKELSDALSEMGDEGKELSILLEKALPTVSLCEHNSLTTAYGNDRSPDAVFAQQLLGHGKAGDTLLALTTSGNSKNCLYAATLAKAMGIHVVSITGALGGRISALADVSIKLPETETYLVQELALPLYHYLCAELEKYFFS